MRVNTLRSIAALLIALNLLVATPPRRAAAQAAGKADTASLIQLLQSGAGETEKEDALRTLARSGGPEAVPVLASLLAHPRLATLARAALEAIPGPAAGAALRQALGTLKGRDLAGVIDSLGKRRDAQAEAALQHLVADKDDDVALAAATALGRIGGEQTAGVLEKALAQAPPIRKAALADACLNCAENLVAQKKIAQAVPIYERLRQADLPEQIRRPATLSLIQARGEEAVALVAECLASADWSQVELGIQGSRMIPGAAMTRAMLDALPKAETGKQALIIRALGDRQDGQILPAMVAAAGQGDPAVRAEALRVIGRLGGAQQAPLLFTLAADKDPELASTARMALDSIPGKAMDEAVLAGLGAPEPGARLLALQTAARRQIKNINPALLKLAVDPDRKVRLAALKRLGEVGGRAEAGALLAKMMKPENAGDLGALEAALWALGAQMSDPQKTAAELLGAMTGAAGPQRCALLRLLAASPTAQGLQAVRAAAKDPDPATQEAAFRTLCDWPDAAASDDLLQAAKSAPDPTRKILALRGTIRLAGKKEVAPERKAALIAEAAALVRGEEEKKMLLGAVQGAASPRLLAIAAGYLEDPATQEEAVHATLAIAERLSGPQAPRLSPPADQALREAMRKVARATRDEELRQRAQAVLDKVK